MFFDPVRAAGVVLPQLETAVRDAGGMYVAADGVDPRSWGYAGADHSIVVFLDYVDWGVASAPATTADSEDRVAQEILSWWRGSVQQLTLNAMLAAPLATHEGIGTIEVSDFSFKARRYVSGDLETFVAAVRKDFLVAIIGQPTYPIQLLSTEPT